jgi:hypothetical protein
MRDLHSLGGFTLIHYTIAMLTIVIYMNIL